MGEMFDSVNAAKIPATAKIVAGYIDGKYAWTDAEWGRFPSAIKVRITVFASTDDGRVLDVERGDATPQEAPGWVTRRRESTAHHLSGPACIYTSLDNWQTVRTAFEDQKVAEPDYWIAHYDNVATVPTGAVAKQYQSTPGYDLSVTLPDWPIPPTPSQPTKPVESVTSLTAADLMQHIVTTHVGPDSRGSVQIPGKWGNIISAYPNQPGGVILSIDKGIISFSGAPADSDLPIVVWTHGK